MGEWERAVFGRPLILFVLFLQGAQRVRFLSFRRGGPMWPPARMVPRIFVGADVLIGPPEQVQDRFGDVSPAGE